MSDAGDPKNSGHLFPPERLSADAVRALYDLHGRDLLTFLSGVLRNSDAAQDVCQATFQRLLEAGHGAREETVRGWLFKVAFHEAMAYRRKQSQRDKLQQEYSTSSEEWTTTSDSLQSLVRAEEVAKLKQLLQELPAEQQWIVQQRIHENKTFAAIADELKVPLGTVLTRMRLALQKLQKRFE